MTRLARAGKCVGLGASGPVDSVAARARPASPENASQPKPKGADLSKARRLNCEGMESEFMAMKCWILKKGLVQLTKLGAGHQGAAEADPCGMDGVFIFQAARGFRLLALFPISRESAEERLGGVEFPLGGPAAET